MKLYEIDERIRQCVDQETGEILDENLLDSLLIERETKIENVACWVKELTYEAQALKAEKEQLEKRQKATENKVKSLKQWLIFATGEEKFKSTRVSVSFVNSEAVVVDDDTVISKRYCKVTYTPVKTLIKEALKSGKKVKGAHIQTNVSCVVK